MHGEFVQIVQRTIVTGAGGFHGFLGGEGEFLLAGQGRGDGVIADDEVEGGLVLRDGLFLPHPLAGDGLGCRDGFGGAVFHEVERFVHSFACGFWFWLLGRLSAGFRVVAYGFGVAAYVWRKVSYECGNLSYNVGTHTYGVGAAWQYVGTIKLCVGVSTAFVGKLAGAVGMRAEAVGKTAQGHQLSLPPRRWRGAQGNGGAVVTGIEPERSGVVTMAGFNQRR